MRMKAMAANVAKMPGIPDISKLERLHVLKVF
jgi:hypothetical protein